MHHKSVLLNETLLYLNIKQGNSYLDCTGGAGGHAMKIAEALEGHGTLHVLDRDTDAYEHLKSMFAGMSNVSVRKMNYKDIELSNSYDGILLDLGISSYQIDTPDRGFSYRFDSPLDFRMDQEDRFNIKMFFKTRPINEIAKVMEEYSDERDSRKIAEEIKKRILKDEMNTTFDLKNAIIAAKNNRDIKFAMKRVFMAFRILVNDELDSLKTFLGKTPYLLNSGGRLVVLSYHSIEDRMVKQNLLQASMLKVLTKNVVKPKYTEVIENKRAKAAKLRCAERI